MQFVMFYDRLSNVFRELTNVETEWKTLSVFDWVPVCCFGLQQVDYRLSDYRANSLSSSNVSGHEWMRRQDESEGDKIIKKSFSKWK